MWYEPVGKVIHTKRKTPKQRKEYKKLKAKEKNARKNLSICEKKLEKFNKENQKIIGKYLDLDCKVDEKNEIVYNISQEIDEYEEQFKTREENYEAY
jgi:peptidoglycan hydrolase CwlO-like protein